MFLFLLFLCGYQDVSRRRVHNWAVAVLFLHAVAGALWLHALDFTTLGLWAAVLAAGVVLYSLRYISAGDVKAISANFLYGFAAYRWPFLLSFAFLWLLDGLWCWKYGNERESLRVPLVWLWAWSCAAVLLLAWFI